MGKRDLFAELKQGLEDARDYEEGKLTLRTTEGKIPHESGSVCQFFAYLHPHT